MTTIDPKAFRNALGAYPTGVTVVTAVSESGEPVGFTANSFASVSLEPPLLLVCPARTLTSFPVFETCDRFAINILAEGQEEVSNIFARYAGDRFDQVNWQSDHNGMPIIDGVAASFSCHTESVTSAGDHVILLGKVETFTHDGSRGLGYAAGRYFSLGLEQAAAEASPSGRASYVGAIVLADDAILMMPGDEGWQVPKIKVEGSTAVRSALTTWFAETGMEITLRRTYSIFDGPNGEHFTFFLADARNEGSTTGTFMPIREIADLPVASGAERSMLDRYVRETEARAYGFYVGDSETGYVHASPQDD